MKKNIISLMILSMLTACAGAVAESLRNGGRGNGAGGGSMQTLNEGIAYMNGDGVDQDYEKALQLFLEACEAGSMKAARYVGMSTSLPVLCLRMNGPFSFKSFSTASLKEKSVSVPRIMRKYPVRSTRRQRKVWNSGKYKWTSDRKA
jgi:hypothetical protein